MSIDQPVGRRAGRDVSGSMEPLGACVAIAANGVWRRDRYRAPRHNGRNGVFVHHLGYRVPQKNHILVKGLDLTLQFDAIDQINRHWYMLPAQDVQKRVLEKLPFIAHDMFRVQELFRSAYDNTQVHAPVL